MKFSLLMAVLLAAGTAAAETVVVTPTGDAAADFQTLQGALDRGGTVFVRARIDDAPRTPAAFVVPAGSSLILRYDTELVGELDEGARSTIRSDDPTRPTLRITNLSAGASGPSVSIRGLRIERQDTVLSANQFGIQAEAATAVTVQGNTIVGAVGSVRINPRTGPIGKVLVIGNKIETNRSTHGLVGVYAHAGGPIEVAYNEIAETMAFGIRIHAQAGAAVHDNVVRFVNNTVSKNAFSNGILVTQDGAAPAGTITVTNNTIAGETDLGDAIILSNVAASAHAVVTGNHVVLAPVHNPANTRFEAGGIAFSGVQPASGVLVAQNVVSGAANYALAVKATDVTPETRFVRNVFRGNRIERFAPSWAHVVIGPGALQTALAGFCGSAIVADGTDSVLTGCTMAGSVTLGNILSGVAPDAAPEPNGG
jgi:hypothetical protein